MLKYVNFAVQILAAGHLTFSVIQMYGTTIPADVLPIDSKFAGKFKYLTFWNVVS